MARLEATCSTDPLARVEVRDAAGRMVGMATGVLRLDFAAGLYEVTVRARERAARGVASLAEGGTSEIDLALARYTSAAPTTRSTTYDARHVELLNRATSATATDGRGCLAVMLRRFAATEGPTAHDVRVEIEGTDVDTSWLETEGAGCATCLLDPGMAVVHVAGPGSSAVAVPIWSAWQTVVVVPVVGGTPSMDHVALHCLPVGVGWSEAAAAAELTEQLFAAVADRVARTEIAAAVDGATPLHALVRGDTRALATFDPRGVVARADVAAMRITSARADTETLDRVADLPVLASSADTLLRYEARHPWTLDGPLASACTAHVASSVLFRWRPDDATRLPAADPKRWDDTTMRLAARLPRERRLRRMAMSERLEPATSRLLSHIADRAYATQQPPAEVVRRPVGDLVLTTGLPAVALQHSIGVADVEVHRRRALRRRLGGFGAAALAAVALAPLVWPDGDGSLRDDELRVVEDTVGLLDPLANDEGNGELRLTGTGQASHGAVLVLADGLSYTPDPDYVGADEFDYTAVRDGDELHGTVHVDVTPVNDPPIAVADTATVTRGATIDIDVLANDHDVDGDAIELLGVEPADRARVNGERVRLVAPPEGDTYVFRYAIGDGAGGLGAAEVVVTLTDQPPQTTTVPASTEAPVNAPVAQDDSATTPVGEPVAIDVISNDEGPTELTVVEVETPPQNGAVEVDAAVVTYSPDEAFAGTDIFTYRLRDGDNLSEPATVRVVVLPAITVADVALDDPPSGSTATAIVVVRLGHPSVDTVTVAYTTADGSAVAGEEYTATSGVITIPPDTTERSIGVEILSGGAGGETFEVRLSEPAGATIDDDTATITILHVVE